MSKQHIARMQCENCGAYLPITDAEGERLKAPLGREASTDVIWFVATVLLTAVLWLGSFVLLNALK